jgi:hypothetical protein
MRDLPAIEALYLEIDTNFERLRTDATNSVAASRIEAKQRLNDQPILFLPGDSLRQQLMTPVGARFETEEPAAIVRCAEVGTYTIPMIRDSQD